MQAYTSPRRIFGFLGDNRLITIGLGVVVAAVILLTGFFYNRHEIRIYADGKETNLVVRGGTVKDAIGTAKIVLGEKDIVEPPLTNALRKNLEIRITRMIPISLKSDTEISKHWVPVGTVEQTLKKLNVTVNVGDQIIPELNKRLTSGDTIEVIRFSETFINESVKISYKIERRNDNDMEKGLTKVVKPGKDGLTQRTVKVTLKNGKEVKREVIGEKVVTEPVNKVIAVGTLRTKVVSRGGKLNFSRSLSMNSSAYTHTGRNTASGIYPYKGAVAVDPKVIPIGSNLYIEGYGYAKALDVGSSIKGQKIDLFFETEKEARQWGRRPVKVYVL